MSNTAKLYDESGQFRIVNACDCVQADKGKDYRCPGKRRGKECLAPLELRIGNSIENYFAVTAGAHHIHGCPNDESGRTLTTKVLDREGKECSWQELYEKLLAKKSGTQTGGGGKGEEEPEEKQGVEKPEEDEPLPGDVNVVIRRAPRNFREIIKSLRDLEADDTYAGPVVEDLLCNRDSVAKVRRNGFPDNIAVVVEGRKTLLPKGYYLAEGQFGLAIDGTSYDDKLIIVFRANEKALEIVKKAVVDKKHICVINRWRPERNRKFKGIFVGSEVVTEHMVYVME